MTEIPAGYMQDAKGNLVPENNVKPIDRARNDLVLDLVGRAMVMRAALKAFKTAAFEDIDAFVELSAEQYGVSLGGKKGNLTLLSFDGRYKIQRQVSENISFDERLAIAKELIDKCITKWAEGVNDHIRTLVEHAFRTNKQGQVSTGAILGLRRLSIDDADWKKAMEAIADSIQQNNTSIYVRFYERVGQTEIYQPIALDVAVI